MSPQIRGQGGHLGFPISLKITNLVEDMEILLPVKFHKIPFRGFRVEVKNVSANQRPGQPSCYSDRPEKNTDFVDDTEIFLPVKFPPIQFSGFRGEVENVSANQRPGQQSWFFACFLLFFGTYCRLIQQIMWESCPSRTRETQIFVGSLWRRVC